MTTRRPYESPAVTLQLRRPRSEQLHAGNSPRSASETQREFPLERVCVHLYEPFQLKFARHAQQLVKVACATEADVGHNGLTLRGETESELELAATILRNFYGSQVRIGPLKVRYRRGLTLEEPVMGVRVNCDAERMETVKTDLIARGALIVSSELVRDAAVVRAVGPLAKLIGYAKALRLIAGNSVRQLMWLSHYAPTQEQIAPERAVPGWSRKDETQEEDDTVATLHAMPRSPIPRREHTV